MKRSIFRCNEEWVKLYTVFYLCCITVLLLMASAYGKVLIWHLDGYKQPYTVTGYVGRMLRDLFAGKGYKMLSYTLGQGMDVLTTCSYYGYTDPLTLIAGFFSERDTEIAYMLITLLRLYLAGVFFGCYVRKLNIRDDLCIVCGTMIYVFNGGFISLIGRHPYFINGAIYLPLLLSAVESVFQARKWLFLTLVTALMIVVNFYFAFINTIVAIVYVAVRLITRIRETGVRRSAVDGLTLIGGYLLGLSISAIIFLPIAMLYFNNGRMGIKAGYAGSMLHYDKGYYLKTLANLFVPWKKPTSYTQLNFVPTALSCLAGLLFLKGKRPRQVRMAIFLCFIGASIPTVGFLFNGGAYVTNRWFYAADLFVCLGCCIGMQGLIKAERKKRFAVMLISILFGIVQIVALLRAKWQRSVLFMPIFLIVYSAMVLLRDIRPGRMRALGTHKQMTVAMTSAMCMVLVVATFHPMGRNYLAEQMDRCVYDQLSSKIAVNRIEDNDVYRTAKSWYDDPHALLLDYMGTSFFWSLVDSTVSDYYRGLWLATQTKTYQIYNLGASSMLNAVAGVKYFIRLDNEDSVIPAGYLERTTTELPDGSKAHVYENPLALPLGYVYDMTMDEEKYDTLPVDAKMQALTRFAIVTESIDDALMMSGGDTFEDAAVELDYTVITQQDAKLGNGMLQGDAQGIVTLGFEAPEDSETYLLFEGIKPLSIIDGYNNEIAVKTDCGISKTTVPNPFSNFYFPKDNFAMCIGSGPLKSCDIILSDSAEYACKNLRIVSIPLSRYRRDIAAKLNEPLKEISLENDRLTGRITVNGSRVLQIAIPYSRGWRAWVDGVEQRIIRCGGMYMGIVLESGEHFIEMKYCTPGLKAGAIISIAGLVLTMLLVFLGNKRQHDNFNTCD